MSNLISRNNFDPFYDLFDFPFADERKSGFMKTDIVENKDSYKLSIEVPSVKKDGVKISLKNGYLNVAIEKKNDNVEKDSEGKILHKERFFGTYKRSYYVGDEIKQNDISAALNNGVLTINIVKPTNEENKEVQYIEVK